MASVVKRINQFNSGIAEQLLKRKKEAILESPFRFYRGTCHLFAEDFVKLAKYKPKITSWICGDLHFENFGSFKAENRLVYFDLNDFDESILAGPEPEACRFLTSVCIAASQMKVAPITLNKALFDIMTIYCDSVERGKALMLEERTAQGYFRKYFEQQGTLNRKDFIDKRTYKKKGALLLKTDDLRYYPLEDKVKAKIHDAVAKMLRQSTLSHLVFEDASFRVAGTGSIGIERYCVLCFSKKHGKYYLLDIKETRPSAYTGLIKVKQPKFKDNAERVVAAQNMMQFMPPDYLTKINMGEKWFLVKELQPKEDSITLEDFEGDFGKLSEVAKEMAKLMAYAHIRSSGHLVASDADGLRKLVVKKHWIKDIVEISVDMAHINRKYYNEFVNNTK